MYEFSHIISLQVSESPLIRFVRVQMMMEECLHVIITDLPSLISSLLNELECELFGFLKSV